jgi:Tfp pilus assembly protein PilF
MFRFRRLVWVPAVLLIVLNSSLAQVSPQQGTKSSHSAHRSAGLAKEGVSVLERGDTVLAKRMFRRAIALDPNNVSARTYLGIIADHSGEFTEAEHQFAAAARAAPASPEARNNHGAILLKLGRKKSAAEEFEASLRMDSGQAGALVNLAQIRFAEGTPQGLHRARDLFQRAEVTAADAEIARSLVVISLHLHESGRAAEEFPRYLERLKNAPPALANATARAELGAALLEAGLFAEAATELEAAVSAEPANEDRVVLLARAYRGQKNLQAAGRALESAVASGVESAAIYAILAEIYEDSGHAENAIPAMRRAIQLEPRNEKYRFRYAMLLTDTQAPQAAVMRLQEALAEFPRSSRLWFAMGLAQFQDNKNDAAAKAFARALELNAQMFPALAYLGMISVDQGKASDAIPYYRRALVVDEHSPVVHYLIAEAFSKLSPPDEEENESHLKRALVLDPKFQQAHLALAKLYLRNGRFAEAATELEGVIKTDPKLAEAYYQLGRAYMRLKKKDEAQATMAKFESLSKTEKEQSENQRRDIVRRLADVRF